MTIVFSREENILVRRLRRIMAGIVTGIESETETEITIVVAEHLKWIKMIVKSKYTYNLTEKRAGYNSLLISFGNSELKSIVSPVIGC